MSHEVDFSLRFIPAEPSAVVLTSKCELAHRMEYQSRSQPVLHVHGMTQHRVLLHCNRGRVCPYITQGVIPLVGASLRHSKITRNYRAFTVKGLAAFASTSSETNAERQGGTHLQATVESTDSPGTAAEPAVRLREPLVLCTQSMIALYPDPR